jgi:hypothetical protein
MHASKLGIAIVVAWLGTLTPDARAEGGTGFHFHLKSDASLCLDARMDRGRPHTEVWVYRCNESDAQRWAVVQTEDEHRWHPIVGPGGLCLDVRGAHQHSGTTVQLYPCHFGENQRFRFDRATGFIIEEHSGKCLGVARLDEKQPVRLERCDVANWNREWLFEYNKR